jgi:hypothetical protein
MLEVILVCRVRCGRCGSQVQQGLRVGHAQHPFAGKAQRFAAGVQQAQLHQLAPQPRGQLGAAFDARVSPRIDLRPGVRTLTTSAGRSMSARQAAAIL